ncbi:alkaline/neutral invertase B [Spatholobus suberectus]|nr:alkaline/neutral invertase B [Spatholobus suberectus]
MNTPGSWVLDPYSHPITIVSEGWEALRCSLIFFRVQPVDTIAALDNFDEKVNYDQVLVKDFVPSALAFLMNGELDIVKILS